MENSDNAKPVSACEHSLLKDEELPMKFCTKCGQEYWL